MLITKGQQYISFATSAAVVETRRHVVATGNLLMHQANVALTLLPAFVPWSDFLHPSVFNVTRIICQLQSTSETQSQHFYNEKLQTQGNIFHFNF